MHIDPDDCYYAPSSRRYPPNGYKSDIVIPTHTAERWLKRISIAGTFVLGMFVGVAIKWWLS